MSRSGYYKYVKTLGKVAKDYEDYLLIKEIFDKGNGKWGHRTIYMKLIKKMNLKKILRIMKKYKLYTKIRKLNPYKQIMKKTESHKTFENTLDRKFKPELPHKVFGTDITYVYFNYRRAYLCIVKDFCTGEIISYKTSQTLDIAFVLEMVRDLQGKNLNLRDVILQSDQGFHFTLPDFVNLVSTSGILQSMSRKGCCIDNAPTESFFGHFKDEVEYKACKTFEELNLEINKYMIYYNFWSL